MFIIFVAMNKYTLLLLALFIVSCSSDEEELPFYVADNGVTIKARDWVTVGTTSNYIEGMDLSGWDVSKVTDCQGLTNNFNAYNWPESKRPNFTNCNPDQAYHLLLIQQFLYLGYEG